MLKNKYTLACDRCGKGVYDDNDFKSFHNAATDEGQPKKGDWLVVDGMHFCHECFTYDSDGKAIIKDEIEPPKSNKYLRLTWQLAKLAFWLCWFYSVIDTKVSDYSMASILTLGFSLYGICTTSDKISKIWNEKM